MSGTVTTPYIISPPFGNYITAPHCTRVLGSFTLESRPGLLYYTARTLRPINGGWVNRIGLRNRGIRKVKFRPQHIYSLVGLSDGDWETMLELCPTGLRVEVNLGCPNVHQYGIPPEVLAAYCRKFRVIVKLPPTLTSDAIAMCVEAGADHLHLCNTLPSARGGISGTQLRPFVENLIYYVATHYPNITIIAGGGIYNRRDVTNYALAGAHHFSLATIWLSPWRVPALLTTAGV